MSLSLAMLLAAGCGGAPESGVSLELAAARSSRIDDLRYRLHFEIPSACGSEIEATETISFNLKKKTSVILDFREDPSFLHSLSVNGRKCATTAVNEHIIIPRSFLKTGTNTISISFRAGEQSLNRRQEFLYTLLVPDRARTLFPCFEQPDLKAKYTLSLNVPEEWTAVSNTRIVDEHLCGDGRKTILFDETEALSTYLFSFVAGLFDRCISERGGRTVSMYHRENDQARLGQRQEIFNLVFDALDYMEEYTGIPYPFAKYDFVVLPDFQYGGMEHTGATLYNDKRIFLGPEPTTEELLSRAQLIAHETAHMWFGDYVTMRWFNDVWTKEVFANWFAAQIVRPIFPSVNHLLGDLKTYYAPAYAEDRTVGSNAVRRPLDNLCNAGLIYCNIVYDKAPVVMDALARKMGPEAFREGLREYLRTYAYSNADWDDLVAILDRKAGFDVKAWSDRWIKEAGMPEACFSGRSPGQLFPDTDGVVYGCFLMDEDDAEYCYRLYSSLDEEERMGVLMNLYENVWRRRIDASRFTDWAASAIYKETNPLIFGSLLDYADSALLYSGRRQPIYEHSLCAIAADPSRPHEMRLQAFRAFSKIAASPKDCRLLYDIWRNRKPFPDLVLGEKDYTDLSFQLMLRYPERFEEIGLVQRSRISNPDRLQAFDFVSEAAAPEKSRRAAFFNSLMQAQNRRPESRVLTAIDLLCSPLRGSEAAEYIFPALEILPEIQRTGDIFFPASWCRRFLGSQISAQAKQEVEAFLAASESMHPLLRTKILQAAGWLLQ